MAAEYKIIKIRRGARVTFIPSTLLPGELWMSTDTGEAFFCYSAGNYKQFSTFEDMVEFVKGVNEEIILELTDEINQATTNANQATTYANQAGDYANSKGDYANQKGQEAQAIIDSAAPIINTNLQATYADKATQTGEFLHVDVADNALVEITKIEGNTLVTPTNPDLDISPDNVATITSAKNFDVVSCGKNLFDGLLELGSLNNVGNNEASNESVRSKNYIKVKPNTIYALSNDLGYLYDIHEYTSAKSFIKNRVISYSNSALVTTSPTTEFIRFRSSTILKQNNLNAKYQIELGSTPTPYEPYKSNKINISYELNKLENGVADTRERLDDKYVKYTHRIGRVVFDGSVSEVREYNPLAISKEVRPNISNFKPKGFIVSDKFKAVPSDKSWGVDTLYIMASASEQYNVIAFRIPINMTAVQFFTENPTTVLYELETPIETIVEEPSTLTSYKGTTNVFTTADIQPELTGTFKSELWANEYKTEKNIGLLENLDTANKDNLVRAINETREIAVNASYNVSEQFDAAKTYAVGDYMIRNNTLFRCKDPITVPKPFNISDWESTTVGKEMTTANDNLANKILMHQVRIQHTGTYTHTDIDLTSVLPSNKTYRMLSINLAYPATLKDYRPTVFGFTGVVVPSIFWIRSVADVAYTGGIDIVLFFLEV